ncbi:hypothetical protein OS493_022089 [Desmophyllum pertusum]|uniref:Uncharacterized protein n=1 Tax=Desmophyllum pertusum TaxID=174260 RepID=A0A9W9YMD5_9CNID|nr:hypothetical protein OS493_022089 [Desmophyllum pertusum]
MNNYPYCFYFPDSVNYKCKPCLPEVELHDFLGDFTNEVDEGGYITEFVSAGAKNNGITMEKNNPTFKVKDENHDAVYKKKGSVANKQNICEYQKKYRAEHQEENKLYMPKYWAQQKEKMNDKTDITQQAMDLTDESYEPSSQTFNIMN